MLRRFSESIRLKLVGTVLVAVLVATLLSGLAAAWRETSRRFQMKREALAGISSAIAASVAAATLNGDKRGIAAGLNAIGSIKGIQYAIVVDASGRRLHEIGSGVVLGSRDDHITPNREIGLFTTVRLGTYLVSTPIVSGGQAVGQLAIIADFADLRRALLDSILGALAAGAFAALVGLLVAARLQASITAPIAALTRVADIVRRSGDYIHPAPKLSDDETGRLVEAFNTMMAEIGMRDQALKRQRDRLASEVEERTRDLAAAKDAAEQANAAKSDFLATMSHEIRTPMSGMIVMAEMLAGEELSPKAQRHCDIIVKSGQVLLSLINDILDLSKIEAGRMELERIPCDPASIVEDVAQLFAERASTEGLEIACYTAPDLPRVVLADPLRLTQIVTNLVSNALKFTSQGGVLVEARTVKGSSGTVALRFAVKDTGIGISGDKLATIFDAFTQAEMSTTRRYGGTGIGLTICRQLVAAMGGRIDVASTVGAGSTFSFEIPVEVIDAGPDLPVSTESRSCVVLDLPVGPMRDAIAAIAAELGLGEAGGCTEDTRLLITNASRLASGPQRPAQSRPTLVIAALGDASAAHLVASGRASAVLQWPIGGRTTRSTIERAMRGRDALDAEKILPARAAAEARATFHGVQVLAADDNAVNREVLAEALARLGARVTNVASGEEAIGRAQDGHFDIIFMDGSMPGMDGFTAARRIREREKEAGRNPVPIVALTAHVIGPQSQAWMDCGMNDCIAKPFRLDTIRDCLARWARPAGTPTLPAPAQPVHVADGALIDHEVLRSIIELGAPGDNLAQRVIGLYCEHAPLLLAVLLQCDPGNLIAVAEAAHALKSPSRNIGAARVGDLCDTLEADARKGQPPRTSALDELTRAVEATIVSLGNMYVTKAA